ncbi:hypothetical protein Z517_06784 [Fonsecaea pedrosoi CBS 271.37]|uniref:Transcription factor TFIIIC triple barrel domain-containing protein n=1 Tax=Fonsecaea pedrosoi CBS 271.37 TaxID=1442368 RepID=A0A0D2H6A1_9EURO|nr:uncharacterized protein Z517_06784 [Fonsecaea pedrosoi CBS 271.37]KIW80169.1 hypothetical protein Z517_06784 [Fonsecaea pedrosoi CBS 271.37]
MDQHQHSLEDDFEYEYDDAETETFLVDIDLSSWNSNIKSNVPVPPKPVTPAKRKLTNSGPPTPGPDEPGAIEFTESGAEDAQEPRETPSRINRHGDDDTHLPSPSHLQILDLATANPIISYQGQVYSCMWADMVGTNMFFTHTGVLDAAEVLRSTDDYDLIGMSRIKLVGQAAKLLKKEKSSKGAGPDGQAVNNPAGASGEVPQAQHRQDDQMRKQAAFLEKLVKVKRDRGETDVVRTFVDDNVASVDSAAVHETQRGDIQDPNEQVVQATPDTRSTLEEIYSQSDSKAPQMHESSERLPEAHDEADITI